VRKNSQALGLAVITADAFNSQNPWLQLSEVKESGFIEFSEAKEQAQNASSAPAPLFGISTPVATDINALVAAPFIDQQDTQPVQAKDMLDSVLDGVTQAAMHNSLQGRGTT